MIFAIYSDEEVLGVPNSTMISIVMMAWLSTNLPSDGSISIDDLSIRLV